jgi:hypothetical protein
MQRPEASADFAPQSGSAFAPRPKVRAYPAPNPAINNPYAAALAATEHLPSNLANSACPLDDVARQRTRSQVPLQGSIFVIIEIRLEQARKQAGFDERQHYDIIRLCRMLECKIDY